MKLFSAIFFVLIMAMGSAFGAPPNVRGAASEATGTDTQAGTPTAIGTKSACPECDKAIANHYNNTGSILDKTNPRPASASSGSPSNGGVDGKDE